MHIKQPSPDFVCHLLLIQEEILSRLQVWFKTLLASVMMKFVELASSYFRHTEAYGLSLKAFVPVPGARGLPGAPQIYHYNVYSTQTRALRSGMFQCLPPVQR